MEKNTNSKWVIINITCIATALACIGLTFWGNFKSGGVITIDAYIGVIATLIGICATIMIGAQIWNHIEYAKSSKKIFLLERELLEIRQIKEDIEAEKFTQIKRNDKLRTAISNAYITFIRKETDEELKSLYYIFALSLQTADLDEIGRVAPKSITMTSNCIVDHLRFLFESINTIEQSDILIDYIDDFKNIIFYRGYDDYDEIMYLHSAIVLKLNELKYISEETCIETI